MRRDLADIVCCPVHKTRLEVEVRAEDEAGDILEGSLTCAACRFAYPIEEGIPNLLPPSYHVDEVRDSVREAKPRPQGKAGKAGKGRAA